MTQTNPQPVNPGWQAWMLRALLAMLLLLGSELLLWTNPLERPLVEWLLIVPGYLLIAAVLLDVLARFHARRVFDLMVVAGIYGLLASTLLNPQTALDGLPGALVTRVLGAYTLLGLEMLWLYLALTGGSRWRLLLFTLPMALAVGLAWGTWVRWSPIYTDVEGPLVTLETMLLVVAVGVALAVALWIAALRVGRSITTPADLLLGRRGLSLTVVGLLLLFIVRVLQDYYDFGTLVLIALVIGVCFVILWFRRLETKPGLIADVLPPAAPALYWPLLMSLILFAAGAFAYDLPHIPLFGSNQIIIITAGFTLYGAGWLPFVAAVLGVQAYTQQVRTAQL